MGDKISKYLFITGVMLLAGYFGIAYYLYKKAPTTVYEVLNQPCPIVNVDKKVCRGDFISYESVYNKYLAIPPTISSVLHFNDGTSAILPVVVGMQGLGMNNKVTSSNTPVPMNTPLKKGYLERMAKYDLPDGKVSYSRWITGEVEVIDCSDIMEKRLRFR